MDVLVLALAMPVASCVLADQVQKSGRGATNYVWLLIGLSLAGIVCFWWASAALVIVVWGIDTLPDDPIVHWEEYILRAGALAGALVGIGAAFVVAHRTDPRRVRERQEAKADYDEPEQPGPPAGPAPRS